VKVHGLPPGRQNDAKPAVDPKFVPLTYKLVATPATTTAGTCPAASSVTDEMIGAGCGEPVGAPVEQLPSLHPQQPFPPPPRLHPRRFVARAEQRHIAAQGCRPPLRNDNREPGPPSGR